MVSDQEAVVVPDVTHGGRTRGLLRYLTSPKEQAAEQQLVGLEPRELHTNPHVFAGYEGVLEEWAAMTFRPGITLVQPTNWPRG